MYTSTIIVITDQGIAILAAKVSSIINPPSKRRRHHFISLMCVGVCVCLLYTLVGCWYILN